MPLDVRLLIAIAAIILVLDFFPIYGIPAYSGLGRDTGHRAINLGFPLPLFTLDPQTGFHVGPITVAALILQAGLLGILGMLALAIRGVRWLFSRLNRKFE